MPRLADAGLRALRDELLAEELHEARSTHGELTRDLLLAGRRVRLRFAGEELAATLLPAFGERATPPAGDPDVTLSVWEGSRALPPLRTGPAGLVREGPPGGLVAVQEGGAGLLTIADGPAVLCRVSDRESLPWWERAAPMRPALFLAVHGAGRALVHAGAVGTQGAAALLVGPGGSGKTTSALAALRAQMDYLGDDYVLISEDATVWNVFATAKVDLAHPHLGAVAAAAVPRPLCGAPDEKLICDIPAPKRSLPLACIVAPRIGGGGGTRLSPLPPGRALLALAPSTVLQMPFDDGGSLPLLAGLARRLPCWSLEIGDDPAEIPGALQQAIERSR
jgi:hypothetical protein